MKKYMIDSYKQRKKVWKYNALISPLLRLSKPFRNKKIWIFGCWNGTKYDDNARFLFEYVCKFHPEITAIWITHNQEIVDMLKKEGYAVLFDRSKEARRVMLRAGATFYTNTINDFSDFPLIYGSLVIDVNHGAGPLKFLTYRTQFKKNSIKYFVKKIYDFVFKDVLFDWLYFNYVLVPSDILYQPLKECFGIKKENKYLRLGMPRSDVFKYNYWKDNTYDYLDSSYCYILYMPTYRPYNNTVIKDLVNELIHNNELSQCLSLHKTKMIIKLHPVDNMSDYEAMQNGNFIVWNNNTIPGQFLLKNTKLLITDYSNVCIDYAIANKPLVFYCPDWKTYDKANGLNSIWKDSILPFVFQDSSHVAEELIDFLSNPEYKNEATNSLNKLFCDTDGGKAVCNCEALTEFCKRKLKINTTNNGGKA